MKFVTISMCNAKVTKVKCMYKKLNINIKMLHYITMITAKTSIQFVKLIIHQTFVHLQVIS